MGKSFWQAGHPPTLFAAETLGLGPSAKGVDGGYSGTFRGISALCHGNSCGSPKVQKAGIIGQLVVMAALSWAYRGGIGSFGEILILGGFLGVAGAAFAVALSLASRWYPPEHQGKAMGIAGAGHSGTVLAALFAPGLAAAWLERCFWPGSPAAGAGFGGIRGLCQGCPCYSAI